MTEQSTNHHANPDANPGSYQGLRRAGLTDEELGATEFERQVRVAYARTEALGLPDLSFSWRVRLGITPRVAGGRAT